MSPRVQVDVKWVIGHKKTGPIRYFAGWTDFVDALPSLWTIVEATNWLTPGSLVRSSSASSLN
jgi:hypothetical protein